MCNLAIIEENGTNQGRRISGPDWAPSIDQGLPGNYLAAGVNNELTRDRPVRKASLNPEFIIFNSNKTCLQKKNLIMELICRSGYEEPVTFSKPVDSPGRSHYSVT